MIQTPVIVTFANQKGGVGKTSLCVTFANYLVMKGVRVVVIDCDFQHSILKCRKADLKHYGEELIPYEVWSHEPNSSEAMITLIEKLHNDPGIDVVLMDSPGSLKADGLVPMFVNSDIIAVPFHYDLVTVPSTASFLMFLDRLRKAVGSRMKAQLFIIPNLHDNRVGKRTELLLWDNTRDTFSNYGYVTFKRKATISWSDRCPLHRSGSWYPLPIRGWRCDCLPLLSGVYPVLDETSAADSLPG